MCASICILWPYGPLFSGLCCVISGGFGEISVRRNVEEPSVSVLASFSRLPLLTGVHSLLSKTHDRT